MVWVVGILTVAFIIVIVTLIILLLWETTYKRNRKLTVTEAEAQANIEYLDRACLYKYRKSAMQNRDFDHVSPST